MIDTSLQTPVEHGSMLWSMVKGSLLVSRLQFLALLEPLLEALFSSHRRFESAVP